MSDEMSNLLFARSKSVLDNSCTQFSTFKTLKSYICPPRNIALPLCLYATPMRLRYLAFFASENCSRMAHLCARTERERQGWTVIRRRVRKFDAFAKLESRANRWGER